MSEYDSDFTLGSLIPLHAFSGLGGRDPRVVGVFGVADLALGTIARMTMRPALGQPQYFGSF